MSAETLGHTFVCYKDQYDLTQDVAAQLQPSTGASSPVVMPAARRGKLGSSSAWLILVKCPNDDVLNVFSSSMAEHATADKIEGAPPQPHDEYLSDAANEISPAKSLSHASDSAKYVVQNISIVSVVLGGLGLLTNFAGGYGKHPFLFGVLVLAAAAALALAVWALFPRVETIDNANNLLTVQKVFVSAIWHRAWFARAATGALLFALIWAIVVFFYVSNSHQPAATITTTMDTSGQRPALDIAADLSDLPDDSAPALTVVGFQSSQQKDVASWLGVLSLNTRTAKIQGKVVNVTDYDSLLIRAYAKPGERPFQSSTYYVASPHDPTAVITTMWDQSNDKPVLDVAVRYERSQGNI
ncbi:MAG: hypothetical protein ABSG38_00105 [Spirochaetia bacterium]